MNKISIEELKVLGYEIRSGTKDNTLKNRVLCSKNEDCHNGGICSADRVCFCAVGYKGEKCEIIVGCDELHCNPEISDCIFNEETEEGMCQCKENRKTYFEDKCVVQIGSCRHNNDCYNGGICTTEQTCMCPIGIEGDLCENIKGCEELKCDPFISSCVFDVYTDKGICKCKEEGKVFVNEKCVVTCEKDADCFEGEKCKEEGGAKFCQCPTGRSGDKCSVIDDCVNGIYKNCKGDKGTCKYHEKMEKAFCECENGKVLDPRVAFCKGSCKEDRECKNGGVCDSRNACRCKVGTKGDYCEIVTGCEKLNCPMEISHCVLDETTAEGMCKCKENGKVYVDGRCVGSCKEDRECKNGGVCESRNACRCKVGTKGDYCEIVKGCEKLNCPMEISHCVLDETTAKGRCECKEYGKEYVDGKCVVICEEDTDCLEGEKCKEEGGAKFCQCAKGRSGDKCSVIDDCVYGIYKNCKADKGTCKYLEKMEKAFCECENGKVLDPTVGFCKGTCEVKKDCHHEASCVKHRGASSSFCKCKSPFEGDFCEIVKDCKLVRYANCKGENGTCVYSKEEKRAICKCGEKKELDVSVTYCKDCYCGENGKCTIRNGVKTCICYQNYTVGSDGICHAECKSDADCKNGGSCSRNVCNCTNGTSGDDCGVISGCDKLNCELINAECTFDILSKMATCTCRDSNRVYVNNKCMECQCGEHSTSCKFDQQAKKICECKNGYSPRNGTCTDNTITDTRKELMVYSIQKEYKQTEVFKIYALPS